MVYHPPNCSGRLETKSSRKKDGVNSLFHSIYCCLSITKSLIAIRKKSNQTSFIPCEISPQKRSRESFFFLSLSSRAFCVGTELAAAAEIYIIWFFYIFFAVVTFSTATSAKWNFFFLIFPTFFTLLFFLDFS